MSHYCGTLRQVGKNYLFFLQFKDAQRNFEILCANEWKESLSSYPKLRTYCKFKTMFFAEPYILTLLTN